MVSKSNQDNDFTKKLRVYAECGIPVYVVIDPATAVCTVHSSPQRSGVYAAQLDVPFGEDLRVPLEGRELSIRTDEFPRDPA